MYVQQRNDGLIPVLLGNWGNPTGTAEDIFPPVVHSREKTGWGYMNQVDYSSKAVDELIETGMRTMDDAKRLEIFRQAGKTTYDDAQIIPLMNVFEMHAAKKGIVYAPRNDAFTLVFNINPANDHEAKR